jgi:hypothetical protein
MFPWIGELGGGGSVWLDEQKKEVIGYNLGGCLA